MHKCVWVYKSSIISTCEIKMLSSRNIYHFTNKIQNVINIELFTFNALFRGSSRLLNVHNLSTFNFIFLYLLLYMFYSHMYFMWVFIIPVLDAKHAMNKLVLRIFPVLFYATFYAVKNNRDHFFFIFFDNKKESTYLSFIYLFLQNQNIYSEGT